MGQTRKAIVWIQATGLTNETIKLYQGCVESRWVMLVCCLPHSSSKCAGSPCSWMPSEELHCSHTSKVLHVCDTLSFLLRAFLWGSNSLYLPSWCGKSWLGRAAFLWNAEFGVANVGIVRRKGLSPCRIINTACLFIYLFCVLAPFYKSVSALKL